MIFVDANIFMYAAGAPHACKEDSVALVAAIALGEVAAATSVEVLREILHRYRAINRWADGASAFDRVRVIMDPIVDITLDDIDAARALLEAHASASARDCIHVATARRLRCEAICSYDRGFDAIDTVRRVTPADVLSR